MLGFVFLYSILHNSVLIPLSLSTSSPSLFVPEAPQSFRGSGGSRFNWACLELQGKLHEKAAPVGLFSAIIVFQSVLSCCKGSRTVMLPATATYINTQLTMYLPKQGETCRISTLYKNQWFLYPWYRAK